MTVLISEVSKSKSRNRRGRDSSKNMNSHSKNTNRFCDVVLFKPEKSQKIAIARTNTKLIEHLFNIAANSNIMKPKTQQNSNKRVEEIRSRKQQIIQANAFRSTWAVKNYTNLSLSFMIDSMMRDKKHSIWISLYARNWFSITLVKKLFHESKIMFPKNLVTFKTRTNKFEPPSTHKTWIR